MPAKTSAGLLLYRVDDAGTLEVLLGHMGGPFWARKDEAAWSIPKGEYAEGDDAFEAARREFAEELGSGPPETDYVCLGEVTQSGGKIVTVWAGHSDFDATAAVSNNFELEWPRGSGVMQSFPEIDRAAWWSLPDAQLKLVKGQRPFLDRLRTHVAVQ